ncbi:MAG: exodeoxyribonuclease VII large subunit, partial [Acidobacteria bacterium]|nr:exodeoxyribonuclease VII large subunit [Acidobacteriota bacterium]
MSARDRQNLDLFAEETYTVSSLGRELAGLLREAYPSVWIAGEIQRFRVHGSGHCYFELVEKGDGDDVVGKLDAAIWRSDAARIRASLAHHGQRLTDGLAIRLRATIDFYPPHGKLQIHVKEVDPAFALGQLEARRRETLAELEAAGLLDGPADDLPPLGALRAAMDAALPTAAAPQEASSVEPYAAAIEAKWHKGSGPKAICEALREEDPDFTGSRWAVARLCRRLRKRQGVRPEDIAIPVITAPGEETQVDFGYVGRLYDPEQGVLRKAWVFVMVLGFSRHMYARAVFDQRAETWLWLHARAFEHFGGVPASNRPDNLKAAVVRAAFAPGDEIVLNRSYRELARHYGFVIDPTPVRDPEKKGKVE